VAVIRRPVNLVVTTVDESMSWLLRQLGRARPCAARALTRQREVLFHRQREWDSIRSRGHRMDTSTSAQVTIAVLLDGTLVCAHGASRVNTRIAGVLTPFSLDPRTTFGRGGPGECHRLYVLQQQ